MSEPLRINLDGLAWDTTGRAADYCADCKRNFEGFYDPEEDDVDDEQEHYHVPLVLWRNDGKEMLSLCWPCATRRMKSAAPEFKESLPWQSGSGWVGNRNRT